MRYRPELVVAAVHEIVNDAHRPRHFKLTQRQSTSNRVIPGTDGCQICTGATVGLWLPGIRLTSRLVGHSEVVYTFAQNSDVILWLA